MYCRVMMNGNCYGYGTAEQCNKIIESFKNCKRGGAGNQLATCASYNYQVEICDGEYPPKTGGPKIILNYTPSNQMKTK